MLEPMRPKRSRRSVVGDFAVLLFLIGVIVVGVQLCEGTDSLRPKERDCLSELLSSTRKDTNFTREEVIEYGRCIEAQGGD